MTNQTDSYFQRLWRALLDRPEPMQAPPPPPPPPAPADADGANLRSRAASLELDLRERDERIEQMKREYAALQTERDRAAQNAGRDEVERLLRKLCGSLSNLALLVAAAEAGKEVAIGDMTQLVCDLEAQLKAAGLEPIGSVGGETAFDVALHQRMSGGTVHPGGKVIVQLPGYRLGSKVLQKAMVTSKEG